MQSNGGLIDAQLLKRPRTALLSGPAGGIVGVRWQSVAALGASA